MATAGCWWGGWTVSVWTDEAARYHTGFINMKVGGKIGGTQEPAQAKISCPKEERKLSLGKNGKLRLERLCTCWTLRIFGKGWGLSGRRPGCDIMSNCQNSKIWISFCESGESRGRKGWIFLKRTLTCWSSGSQTFCFHKQTHHLDWCDHFAVSCLRCRFMVDIVGAIPFAHCMCKVSTTCACVGSCKLLNSASIFFSQAPQELLLYTFRLLQSAISHHHHHGHLLPIPFSLETTRL